ncbi:hypothetical protein [Cryptosporangium minutisporangium]|uniref:Uncharacterized protein n=1 Tax=Cryptosporangium minutisporangium TaxID=113569 RepID=A0ABP6TA97_9ACTN
MTDEPLSDAAAARLRQAITAVQRDLDVIGAEIGLVGAYSGGYRIVLTDTGDFLSGEPLYADDESDALWCAASNAQALVNEFRWQVWPVCPEHDLGLHLWSAGAGPDWTLDHTDWNVPAWRCRAGKGHEVALVGELSR